MISRDPRTPRPSVPRSEDRAVASQSRANPWLLLAGLLAAVYIVVAVASLVWPQLRFGPAEAHNVTTTTR
jgi:hypothetical protein